MSSDLPPVVLPIAAGGGEPCLLEVAHRLFGHDVAELIWQGVGGSCFYVARHPGPDNELARLIGHDKAVMIAAELGGLTVAVRAQTGLRHRRVVRLRKAGATAREIALKTAYTERQVYRLLREARAAGLLPPSRFKSGRR